MLTLNNTFIISKIIKLRALAFFQVLFACLFINAAFSIDASAQRDVIITQAAEEIRCRILDETPTRFIYAYVGPKGNILRNEIFKNLVRDFKYNKYESDLPIATSKKGKKKKSQNIALADNSEPSSDTAEKPVKKKAIKEELTADEPIEPEKTKKELRKERKALEAEAKLALEIAKESEKKETVTESEEANQIDEEALEASSTKAREDKVEVVKVIEPKQKETETTTSKEVELTNKVLSKEKTELVDAKEPVKNTEKKVKTEAKPPIETKEETVKEVAETTKKPISEIKESNDLELEKSPQSEKVVKNGTNEETKVISEEKSLVEVPKESTPVVGANSVETTGEFKNYLKWRVGVKAGIGNILDKDFVASNAYGLYQEKLLKGYTFGADLAFFPMEGFGLGVVYTDFRSSNSSENLTFINEATGVEMTGAISNKVSRKFVGPAFFLRKGIDFKTFVVLGVSPGMYFYSNKGDYNQANFEYTGKEFGGAATLGLDFLLGNDIIGRDIILSLEAGYNMGKVNDINYNDGTGMLTLDNPIIMDRLDFSIGLRFMRFPKYLKK